VIVDQSGAPATDVANVLTALTEVTAITGRPFAVSYAAISPDAVPASMQYLVAWHPVAGLYPAGVVQDLTRIYYTPDGIVGAASSLRAGRVSSGQARHEVGHAMGLGQSPDVGDVEYMVNPGVKSWSAGDRAGLVAEAGRC
jgi:hypothetical protein